MVRQPAKKEEEEEEEEAEEKSLRSLTGENQAVPETKQEAIWTAETDTRPEINPLEEERLPRGHKSNLHKEMEETHTRKPTL